jgi:hypothetical protein
VVTVHHAEGDGDSRRSRTAAHHWSSTWNTINNNQ